MNEAWLLHRELMSSSKLRLFLWTREEGLLPCWFRNAGKKSLRGELQPFLPLLVSFSKYDKARYVNTIEARDLPHCFKSEALYCALYMNELIYRLLPSFEPEPRLYAAYERALFELQEGAHAYQPVLRRFERCLLEVSGVFPAMDRILKDVYYAYIKEDGLVTSDTGFLGEHLLEINAERYDNPSVLKTAKIFMRLLISDLPGAHKLTSHRLFRSYFVES